MPMALLRKTNAQDAISPLAPTARPQPGDTIWYRVQISNTGTAPAVISGTNDAAATMQVSDDLSGLPVTYEGTAPDATGSLTGWTTLQQTGPVTGALITGTITSLAVGANAFFVFGVIISVISCSQGLQARGGALGVGHATRGAVRDSIIAVIIANYFMTYFLYDL